MQDLTRCKIHVSANISPNTDQCQIGAFLYCSLIVLYTDTLSLTSIWCQIAYFFHCKNVDSWLTVDLKWWRLGGRSFLSSAKQFKTTVLKMRTVWGFEYFCCKQLNIIFGENKITVWNQPSAGVAGHQEVKEFSQWASPFSSI